MPGASVMNPTTRTSLRVVLFVAPILALILMALWAFLAYGLNYSQGAFEGCSAWVLGNLLGYAITRAKKNRDAGRGEKLPSPR